MFNFLIHESECGWLYLALRQYGLTEQLYHTLGMDVVLGGWNGLVYGLADKGTNRYRHFPWLSLQSKVYELK